MESLFETSYVRTKEMVKETSFSYFFKGRRGLIAWGLPAALAIASIINFVLGIDEFPWGVLFSVLFIVYYIMCYINHTKLVIKRDLESTGKEIAVYSFITENFIYNTSSTGSQTRLSFYDIKYGSKTENYILLISNTNSIYSFRKDGFTKGDYHQFLVFLRNKGIKI